MENILEKYRITHGLTFEAMAEKAALSSAGLVFDHCKGHKRPSVETLQKYEKAFSIPMDSLVADLFNQAPSAPPPGPDQAPDVAV